MTRILAAPRSGSRVELLDQLPTGDLPVGGLQQLGDLVPVDVVTFEIERHPAPVAVMRRGQETWVLRERVAILRIGDEVQGASEAAPALPWWSVVPVEQREPTRPDAKQRAILELGLLGLGESQAERPDAREVALVAAVRVHGRRVPRASQPRARPTVLPAPRSAMLGLSGSSSSGVSISATVGPTFAAALSSTARSKS